MTFKQRFLKARVEVASSEISKEGLNPTFESVFFKLDDILRIITGVMTKYDICDEVVYDPLDQTISLILTDGLGETEDSLTTTIPWIQNSLIVNKSGKTVNTETQALGASLTYLKRQLYMTAFQIAEPNDFDGETVAPNPINTQRARATATLSKQNASESLLKGLKIHAEKLLSVSEGAWQKGFDTLKDKTKDFTEMESEECQNLMLEIRNKTVELEKKNAEKAESEPVEEPAKTKTTKTKSKSKKETN